MFELTTENIATLFIDGSTFFLLGGILTQTSVMRKRGRMDDRLFFSMIILDMVFALADIVTYLADGKNFPGARILNMGGVTVSYIALVLILMIWLHYTMVRFKNVTAAEAVKTRLWLFIPGFVTELLLLVNIFAGFIFNVDETNTYHYGVLFIPMYVVLAFYMLGGFRYMSKYRVGNGKTSLIPVWIYMIPLVAGILVPFVFGGISLTSIGIGMSIAFTHMGSSSEIVISDVTGGDAL